MRRGWFIIIIVIILSSWGRFISRDPIYEKGGVNLYAFVGNDPVNKWDVLGFDIIILFDSEGARRYGHIAVLVGNDANGWDYYSADGEYSNGNDIDVNGEHYNNLKDFHNAEHPDNPDGENGSVYPHSRYEEYVRIPRTLEQDAQARIDASNAVNREYNVVFCNCSDVADDVLGWSRRY